MKKRLAILLFIVLAVLGGAYVWQQWRTNGPLQSMPPLSYAPRPAIGYLAPNFLLNTMDGRQVRLSDNLGRITLVTFWATWCPFCAGELRDFDQLHQQYGNRLAILAINRADTPAAAANFIRAVGISPGVTILMDPTNSVYPKYQATTMPETFLIDKMGVIRVISPSVLTLETMKPLVASYLR